jgi:hypothetical protein
VSWKDLLRLYSNPQWAFNHTPDLRATINALQAISADATEAREEAGQQERPGSTPSLVAPRVSVKGSECLSFLDGFLDRNFELTYGVVWTLFLPSRREELT